VAEAHERLDCMTASTDNNTSVTHTLQQSISRNNNNYNNDNNNDN